MSPCNCPMRVYGVRLVLITHTCQNTPRIEYAELAQRAA